MSQVIAVSKDNIDVVGTAGTIPNNLNYSSAYNTLKYYTAGSTTLTTSAAFGLTSYVYGTVSHSLGYYPMFSVYINDTADASRYYKNAYYNTGIGLYRYATTFITSQVLFFFFSLTNASGGTLSGTVNYFYKIFRNNLGL